MEKKKKKRKKFAKSRLILALIKDHFPVRLYNDRMKCKKKCNDRERTKETGES